MREWRDMVVWTQRPMTYCDVGEIDLTFGNMVPSSSSSPAPTAPPKMLFSAADYLPDNLFGIFYLCFACNSNIIVLSTLFYVHFFQILMRKMTLLKSPKPTLSRGSECSCCRSICYIQANNKADSNLLRKTRLTPSLSTIWATNNKPNSNAN